MSFKEIIEIAKKRGLQEGKAKRIEIVEAFMRGGDVYKRDAICIDIIKDVDRISTIRSSTSTHQY